MFDELSSKLTATLQQLTGRGVLTEEAVKEGLREIRRILLEADVSFDLTREFLERVQAKAVGVDGAQGGAARDSSSSRSSTTSWWRCSARSRRRSRSRRCRPPSSCSSGCRARGKTTTAGKLAKRLKLEQKAPFLVAADVYRPAAVDQLVTLAKQVDVGVHGEPGVTDVVGHRQARDRRGGAKARARTVLVDTAGRLQIDEEMMDGAACGSRRRSSRTRSCSWPTA